MLIRRKKYLCYQGILACLQFFRDIFVLFPLQKSLFPICNKNKTRYSFYLSELSYNFAVLRQVSHQSRREQTTRILTMQCLVSQFRIVLSPPVFATLSPSPLESNSINRTGYTEKKTIVKTSFQSSKSLKYFTAPCIHIQNKLSAYPQQTINTNAFFKR